MSASIGTRASKDLVRTIFDRTRNVNPATIAACQVLRNAKKSIKDTLIVLCPIAKES